MWRSNLALALFGRPSPHILIMTEKHPKGPRDLNQWANRMVDIAPAKPMTASRPRRNVV
jgi:hypothetical protein